MPKIDQQTIFDAPIPLPPLDEQQRIVAEIEKQFTRLEAGVVSLKRVQAALKRYRASVLKAACEGRLVPTEAELARRESRSYEPATTLLTRILEERRAKWSGRGKYKEPLDLRASGYEPDALPEGWASATVEQLNPVDRPCAYGVLQPGPDIAEGVPLVRVGDIDNGKLHQTNLKRISPKIAGQYPRTKLRGGEVAISLVGAIGRTAVIPDNLAGANTARAIGIMPMTSLVNSHWVEIWFRNPSKIAEMISRSHEVARKTLNLEDVRAASVALPPLAEQHRIVAEVERRLSVVDDIEAVVAANLQRAARLRQSILQRAFSGCLISAEETSAVQTPAPKTAELLLPLEFTEAQEPEPRWEEPLPKHWNRTAVFTFAEKEAARLGYNPGDDLAPIIHREGGRIFSGDAKMLGDTGMIFVRGPKKFTITLSPKSGPQRKRFTLAHELGHYLLHSDRGKRVIKICRKGTGLLESEAHWFASAFLIPENTLRQKLCDGLSLARIAEFFGVSKQVVEIRKEALNL